MSRESRNGVTLPMLIAGILAVWRVTHLLQREDGPYRTLARLRERVGTGFPGQLLECFFCLSVWIAAPAAALLGRDNRTRALLVPALSGGAILLQRGLESLPPAPAVYFEDEENDDELLRTERAADGGSAAIGKPGAGDA